jgi:hypothetical protein
MTRLVSFRILGLLSFLGQSFWGKIQSCHRLDAWFVQLLKEKTSCYNQSWTFCKSMLVKKINCCFFQSCYWDWYYNKEFTHAKNERLYVGKCFETILSLMQFGVHFGSNFFLICHNFPHTKPWSSKVWIWSS